MALLSLSKFQIISQLNKKLIKISTRWRQILYKSYKKIPRSLEIQRESNKNIDKKEILITIEHIREDVKKKFKPLNLSK
jgi:hypothetical protein